MPNNLGRDQLWTTQVWNDIDTAVRGQVDSIRVVQKVFNPPSSVPGAANVPADLFDPQQMQIDEGITKPFIEISVGFSLTQSQVDNEGTLHTGQTLAKLAAKSLALAEDMVLLQGTTAQLPQNVKVINQQTAGQGLTGIAQGQDVDVKASDQTVGLAVYGSNLFTGVVQGIAQLAANGQPGPYALLLESSVYADAFSPVANTLATVADRLTPLLPGGFYGTGALPQRSGLLISLGGEPTTIYVAQDAITAYTQENKDGNYLFRVFERLQFVARDQSAFVNLSLQAATASIKKVA